MNNSEISLPRKLTNQLLHLAQLSPDTEVCGLIGADSAGMPASCYPVENSAATPETRFLLNSSQQIEAMRQIRDKGETLFAIYHSHPHSPAQPSLTDIKEASYPDVLHLIISLNTKGVLELRGFKIAEESAEEMVLNLIEA
ncbi:Mov34/MPN/PAD-1 family protein [Methylomonas rosea]|uniref:M67 family metallopeptidase n=1 Tax=Methylomonas rosea TaxID=2952227 RepID=A0ABT1TQ14_9GAMM|nr:M67 family metallopeptidase [Methylomonas sp. WSC-7]MCQ8116855.1 M67 family metallopeptidase [Methylomonas sp. WSC-7]